MFCDMVSQRVSSDEARRRILDATRELLLDRPFAALTVGDVMTPDPLVVPIDFEVSEAIEALTARAVRRAPVVDASGNLCGMVTLDDLLPGVAQELGDLASLLGSQAHCERLNSC